jgi:hypothetical protein
MATKSGQRTGVRNPGLVMAAAAVPVLLTMSAHNAGSKTSSIVTPTEITVASCTADISDIQECHDNFNTGCTKSDKPSYDAYLNFMKDKDFMKGNKIDPEVLKDPVNLEDSDVDDLDSKLPPALSTHNHADFADDLAEIGEGQVRSVVANLYFSKANPGESSNCQLPLAKDGDYHVLIGFDDTVAAAMKGKSTVPKDISRQVDEAAIIVEMTPFVRAQHPGWTLPQLKKHWGEKVKVVGQLMVDNEHNVQGANCALLDQAARDKSKCWRRTVWELHPVLDFYVCNKAAACTADSDDGWVSLDNAR